MRIQHNIASLNAYRNLTNNNSAVAKNLEKLSSGYRINRAGDDAAGLAISEKMRAQITGLQTAQKNANDGVSLVQTAEGALTEVHSMLNRMVELATQSANGTYDNTTDRAQMQKEVDQLLDEINRIADSSNFNGIKLLDGTLGLNTGAFQISAAGAVEANDGSVDISKLVAKEADGSPAVHMEVAGNSTQKAPTATIDLGDLAVKGVAAGAKATVDITVAGTKYTVELDNTTGTGAKDFTTADIATALKTAIQKSANGVKADATAHTAVHDATTTTNNDSLKIGDAIYTIGGTGSSITLAFSGWMEGATYKDIATTTNTFSTDQADDFNKDVGFAVTVGAVDKGTAEGDVVHMATNVTFAEAKTPSTKAGIDIKLEDIVKDGATLTIDGKVFTFKTDANSTVTGANVIDVSTFDKDKQVHAAADLLSKQTVTGTPDGREWKIGVIGNGTTIHVEQTKASTAGKELDSYDKLTAVIEANTGAITAKNAGTKITVDENKLSAGNTLNIDGERFSYTTDFTDKTSLMNAINNNSKLSAKYTAAVEGNDVVIRAKNAADAGPLILGKGLTLQIGDTSDSFNQLNVAVQNMHAADLGIGDLKINTEEAAQDAVDKIKTAINTVSDVRGTLGATQNRLDHTINNLSVQTENITAAESRIRDVDMAEEMMAYTKNNILVQAAQAMLAQANQVPQGVLQLLQ